MSDQDCCFSHSKVQINLVSTEIKVKFLKNNESKKLMGCSYLKYASGTRFVSTLRR